jgi:hypothetical protein
MLVNAIRSGALFAALSTASTLDIGIARRGGYLDICPAGVHEVTVTHRVVHYPVVINTQINADTVIIINGGITINVSTAPTLNSTTVTATSTETITETETETAEATPFVLTIEAGAVPKAKRQEAVSYLQTDGTITTSCNDADSYEVSSGHLFGEGLIYAAPPAALSAVFSTGNRGNITTTFSLSPELAWTNGAFGNTDVIFCQISGVVQAIFSGPAPANCGSLALKSVPFKDIPCAATKKMKKRGARPMRVKARGHFNRF